MWRFLAPDWLQNLVKSMSPTALQKTQALMVVGAFAMGAGTMAAVNQAQVRAQAQAEAGDADQAIQTVAAANADARATLTNGLRAAANRSNAELEFQVSMLNVSARDFTPEQVTDRYDRLMKGYGQQRDQQRAAYQRTFAHERLQLEAIAWTPEQQVKVDERLAELRQAEDTSIERSLAADNSTGGDPAEFQVSAAPGEVELPYDPTQDEHRAQFDASYGFTKFLGGMNQADAAAVSDTVSLALAEADPEDVPQEDLAELEAVPVVPVGPLGDD